MIGCRSVPSLFPLPGGGSLAWKVFYPEGVEEVKGRTELIVQRDGGKKGTPQR